MFDEGSNSKMYAEPLAAPASALRRAPTIAVFPEMATASPNRSLPAASLAISFEISWIEGPVILFFQKAKGINWAEITVGLNREKIKIEPARTLEENLDLVMVQIIHLVICKNHELAFWLDKSATREAEKLA